MGGYDVQVVPMDCAANDSATNHVDDGASQDAQTRAILLYESEAGLVEIIAHRVRRAIGRTDQFDDLMAAGRAGLWEAAGRFDPTRGVQFKSYANVRVQGAMLDFVRKSARLPRRAFERLKTLEAATSIAAGSAQFVLDNALGHSSFSDIENALLAQVAAVTTAMAAAVSIPKADGDDGFDGEPISDPEDAIARSEMVQALRKAMLSLDAEEQAIVRMSFFEDMNLREIAEKLQANKTWVFRMKLRATERLTEILLPLRTPQ